MKRVIADKNILIRYLARFVEFLWGEGCEIELKKFLDFICCDCVNTLDLV